MDKENKNESIDQKTGKYSTNIYSYTYKNCLKHIHSTISVTIIVMLCFKVVKLQPQKFL